MCYRSVRRFGGDGNGLMSKIVVCTCILNQWDYLRAPVCGETGARFICFTDQPTDPVGPWEIQPAFLPYQVASRNSRLPKLLPHLHFRADYSIWHDGNFSLKKTPEYLIDRYLSPDRDIALFRHPCRTNVGQESEILLREKIGEPLDVERQAARWQRFNSPEGLWCGGLIIRRHTEAVEAFNESWWREFTWGSTRDQMALPIARHLTNTPIHTIDGNVYSNDLMSFHWHAAWKDKADNPTLEVQHAGHRERRRRLVEIVG